MVSNWLILNPPQKDPMMMMLPMTIMMTITLILLTKTTKHEILSEVKKGKHLWLSDKSEM